MNFYISKLKLWFRNKAKPRTIEFQRNKVNVITGDSSTGKSSILKIIDYCFLQESCHIVEDIINSSVSWYGLLFYLDDTPYTIIRKAPTNEMSEMVVIFKEGEYLPDESPQAGSDDQRSKVLVILNRLFHIPQKLRLESKIKLNFRHFLMFNYLTEDIISTENTYQDLRFFHDRDFERILDDLFKIIIGFDEMKIKKLESDLAAAKKNTAHKERVQDHDKKLVEKYNSKRKDYIQELVRLGLCNSSDFKEDSTLILDQLNKVVDNYTIQFKNSQIDNKRQLLSRKLQELEYNYQYYISLEKEYQRYVKRLTKQKDSLEPIEYIERHIPEVFHYYETSIIMGKLKESWESLRDSYAPEIRLPANFENRKKELKQEIEKVSKELKVLNPMNLQQQSMAKLREIILLIENLEKMQKEVPLISVKEEDIISLKENEANIQEKLQRLESKNATAVCSLNDYIKLYMGYQNSLSDSYMDCMPMYNIKEHTLMLKRKDKEYAIRNVGSKSNYLFLHLCYFFGLHNLLKEKGDDFVLPFMFIDQPSIPYYENLHNGSGDSERDDAIKLKDAFRLTNRFMEKMTEGNGSFQIIMIEHASSIYWKDLEFFKTCETFYKNKGLIPQNAIVK